MICSSIALGFSTWKEISGRAHAGCPTCRLLRDAVLNVLPSRLPGVDTTASEHEVESLLRIHYLGMHGEQPALKVEFVEGALYFGEYTVNFYADGQRASPSPWPLDPIPPTRQRETRDEKILQIKAWMQNCRDLRGSAGDVPLPKRVVDVSLLNDADGILRLHEPSKGESGDYVCLSHCWGGFQPLQTTQETLEEFKGKDGIPWAKVR